MYHIRCDHFFHTVRSSQKSEVKCIMYIIVHLILIFLYDIWNVQFYSSESKLVFWDVMPCNLVDGTSGSEELAACWGTCWSQQIPLKRWYPSMKLHGVSSQKTIIFSLVCTFRNMDQRATLDIFWAVLWPSRIYRTFFINAWSSCKVRFLFYCTLNPWTSLHTHDIFIKKKGHQGEGIYSRLSIIRGNGWENWRG
jgi:hypothetical protein